MTVLVSLNFYLTSFDYYFYGELGAELVGTTFLLTPRHTILDNQSLPKTYDDIPLKAP